MSQGNIVQCIGAVVDIQFPRDAMPRIYDALLLDESEEHAHLMQLNLPNVHLMMSRPLAEIADLCLHARLVVANDCGPSHIAQGSCVPYVGVLCFPNPSWYWNRPYSRAVIPPDGSNDIQHISAARVLAACREVMACDPRQTTARSLSAPPVTCA